MRISTKIRLNLLLYVSLFLGASGLLLYSFTNLKNLVDDEQHVENLFISALDLNHLTERYFVTPEIVTLWHIRYQLLARKLATFQEHNSDQENRVALIMSQYQSIKDLFDLIRNNSISVPTTEMAEAKIRFHSQLQVKFQDILTHLTQFNSIKRAAIVRAERLFFGVIICFFGLGTITAIWLFFWLKTSILVPLLRLIDAVQIVGSGCLSTPQIEHSNDEIGELAAAFSEMTGNLATITTSRDNLEREIHERQQAEAARIEVENQLHQAHQLEAIGTMAGGFAHRFNNILAAILGYAEIAQEETVPNTTTHEHLNNIIQAGNAARDLVANIMTFSNQSVSLRELTDTRQIVQQAISKMQADPKLADKITIHMESDSSLPPIRMNVRYLRLIVDNLCRNSLEAMGKVGELWLRLTEVELTSILTTTVSPLYPGRYVLLTVSDTGCGIDRKSTKRIFDPFFTSKDIGQGDGIGLAMVLGLVTKHGGSVGVESTPG